jgi:hypothetical protein
MRARIPTFRRYMQLPSSRTVSSTGPDEATILTLSPPSHVPLQLTMLYIKVSQTVLRGALVLRGKVASAPRKLLNAKFSLLRAIICDF